MEEKIILTADLYDRVWTEKAGLIVTNTLSQMVVSLGRKGRGGERESRRGIGRVSRSGRHRDPVLSSYRVSVLSPYRDGRLCP